MAKNIYDIPTLTWIEISLLPLSLFLSALSVVLYVVNTTSDDMTFARIIDLLSSFITNLEQGFYTAYQSTNHLVTTAKKLSFYQPPPDMETLVNHAPNVLPPPSKLRLSIQNGFALIAAGVYTLPQAIATYTGASRYGMAIALVLAAATYTGMVPLFLFAAYGVMTKEFNDLLNFALRKGKHVFWYANAEEKLDAERLHEIRLALIDTLTALKGFSATNDTQFPFNGNNKEKLEALAEMAGQMIFEKKMPMPDTRSFWHPAKLSRNAVRSGTAILVALGALGYACDSGTMIPIDEGITQLLGGNFLLLGLTYLGLKAGWMIGDNACDFAVNLFTGNKEQLKPTLVKYYGWIIGLLLSGSAVLLASRSGYTAKVLYEKQCAGNLFPKILGEFGLSNLSPYLLENNGAADFMDYSTALFNAVFGYLSTVSMAEFHKQVRGSYPERFQIAFNRYLDDLIKELANLSEGKLFEFLSGIFKKLEAQHQNYLLGNCSDIIHKAGVLLGKFGLCANKKLEAQHQNYLLGNCSDIIHKAGVLLRKFWLCADKNLSSGLKEPPQELSTLSF